MVILCVILAMTLRAFTGRSGARARARAQRVARYEASADDPPHVSERRAARAWAVRARAVRAEAERAGIVHADPQSRIGDTGRDEILLGGLSRLIALRYADGHGHETEHTVTVNRLLGHPVSGPALLAGYCHLHRAPRTFRLDRITAAWVPGTGERIIDLPTWLYERR